MSERLRIDCRVRKPKFSPSLAILCMLSHVLVTYLVLFTCVIYVYRLR